jgi:hypothetical protein
MLFRNFNWPAPIANKLDTINRRTLREGFKPGISSAAVAALFDKVADQIALVGYDARTGSATVASSLGKFSAFDQNFAYLWFFHEIVGIKYFSPNFNGHNVVNDKTAVDAQSPTVVKTFLRSLAGLPPAFNLPDEGTFAYHDVADRRKTEPSFQPDDSLWRLNALGFKTAQGFIPKEKNFSDLTAADLDWVSWADVYVYREDAVDVNKLSTNNYSELDPNV